MCMQLCSTMGCGLPSSSRPISGIEAYHRTNDRWSIEWYDEYRPWHLNLRTQPAVPPRNPLAMTGQHIAAVGVHLTPLCQPGEGNQFVMYDCPLTAEVLILLVALVLAVAHRLDEL